MTLIPIFLGLLAISGSAAAADRPAPGASDSVVVLHVGEGRTVPIAELVRRIDAADFVLLGELHDNPQHHRVRADLVAGAATRPAVVFEYFGASGAPVVPPAPDEAFDAWLDANGFDRRGWRWPLHAPLVDAAVRHARAIWGSNVPADRLRPVIREGLAAAPPEWQRLLQAAPLDSLQTRLADDEIITGHCNQLPPQMIPGMRNAQLVRDAAMADALLAAGRTGTAWLVAGNGHVRADLGVPRLLRPALGSKTMLVVGFLERAADGSLPPAAAYAGFDFVVLVAGPARTDPCEAFRTR